MNTFRTLTASALLALAPAAFAAAGHGSGHLSRHWTGVATIHTAPVAGAPADAKPVPDQLIPVRLDLSAPDAKGQISGAFLNGDDRSPSSDGTLTGSHLVLHFGSFARTLEGDVHDGTFTGTYSGARLKSKISLDLHAGDKPATSYAPALKTVGGKAQLVTGDWEVALPEKSAKGESAWTLRVSPGKGDGEIKAVVLRIDGDTNGLYGRFDQADGQYHVTRFSDAGGSSLLLKPEADGTLTLTTGGKQLTAHRPAEARKLNLAPPTTDTEQTTVVNPAEPLRFSAPNLAGTEITYKDPAFKNKVVIVAIGGSWCPNCHDEAPLLVELYNKYHSRGLEVVDLSFEEEDQLKNPERLRAFVDQYHIPYPVLVAGTPDQLNDKLPQGKNLNCWPTAFFVGRDGLVKETHAGFSGPATGEAYTDLKAQTTELIEKLLAQNQSASR